MNLSTLEARTYARCGWDAATPGTANVPGYNAAARIKGFINESYREILAKKGLESLRRVPINWATVANRMMNALPVAVTKIHRIWDTTNGTYLREFSLPDIRRADPKVAIGVGGSVLGPPQGYAVYNLSSACIQQPYTTIDYPVGGGAPLFVISSSAADTAPIYAHLQGIASTGAPQRASAPLNGVTNSAFNAPDPWAIISKFFLANSPATPTVVPVATGNISLVTGPASATPGLLLSRIPPGRSTVRYSIINLYPTPNAYINLTADCDVMVEDLAEAGDEPILPEDFQGLLILGATMKEYGRREKAPLLTNVRAEYNDLLADLLAFANRQVSQIPPSWPPASSGTRSSQLGSWFPVGS